MSRPIGGVRRTTLVLFAALAVGAALPQLHALSFAIRYLLMLMLFVGFLDYPLPRRIADYRPGLVTIVAMFGMAVVAYSVVRPIAGPDPAAAALLIALAPTATAAPVVARLLGQDTRYVVTSVITTNLLAALVLPLASLFYDESGGIMQSWPVASSTLATVLLPLIASRIVRSFSLQRRFAGLERLAFSAWMVAILLAAAAASNFIRNAAAPLAALAIYSTTAIVLCAANFAVGRLIGGPGSAREASQSLGQKNTMLVIWVALFAFSPSVALGPVVYLIVQNLYVGWLLRRVGGDRK